MKKTLSFILVLSFVFSLTSLASAATTTSVTSTLDRANALKNLNLFTGTEKGFDLDRAPTRVEAVVMLLRMLGEEKAALDSTLASPFTDVPTWATKYIAYAYKKGYTNGTTKTTFGSNNLASPEQFVTFMLRALGYSDKREFDWAHSIEFAESLGIVASGKYIKGSTSFMRGDCVDVMFSFLAAKEKGKTTTLAESLINSNIIDITTAYFGHIRTLFSKTSGQ